MMIFAFDMDGTLITDEDKIHPGTLSVLKKIKKMGHKLLIVTGRPLKDALRSIDDIALFDYLVLNNGAYIYNVEKDKIHFKKCLPKKVILKILEFAKQFKTIFSIHATKKIYRINLIDKKIFKSKDYDFFRNFKFILTSKIEKKFKKVTQASLHHSKETIKKIWKLSQNLQKNAKVQIANEVYLDFNNKKTSKYQGLLNVCKLEKWDKKDLVVFGDSDNDLEMLKNVQMSISMGNGTQLAKKSAKKIIGNYNSDTIGKNILKWIKERKLNNDYFSKNNK